MTINLLEQFADRQIYLPSHKDSKGEKGLGGGSFLSCLLISFKQVVGWNTREWQFWLEGST